MIETRDTGAILEFDVEGSAFSLHFPTAKDADRFKRGVVTGALAATVAIGGFAGVATVASHSGTAAVPASMPGSLALNKARIASLTQAVAPAQAALPKPMSLDQKRVLASLKTAAQLARSDDGAGGYTAPAEQHHVPGAGR